MTVDENLQWCVKNVPKAWHDLIAQQWTPPPDSDLFAWRANFLRDIHATALIRDLFTGTQPVSVVSLGDSDIIPMCPEALLDVPDLNPHLVVHALRCAGATVEDSYILRQQIREAVFNSPIYMLMYWWVPVEMAQAQIFKRMGFDLANPGKPKIDVNACYSMNTHGNFFPCFDGKRVLVVGGMADKVARVLSDPAFQERHRKSGIEKGYTVVGTVDTPKRWEVPKWSRLPEVYAAIDRFEGQYDFALVSGGTMALLYCEHIRKRGKQAFDYGAIERQLLGERHSIGGVQFDVPENNFYYDGPKAK